MDEIIERLKIYTDMLVAANDSLEAAKRAHAEAIRSLEKVQDEFDTMVDSAHKTYTGYCTKWWDTFRSWDGKQRQD